MDGVAARINRAGKLVAGPKVLTWPADRPDPTGRPVGAPLHLARVHPHAPSGPSRGSRCGATARHGPNGRRTLGPMTPDPSLVARQACHVTQRQGGPGKGPAGKAASAPAPVRQGGDGHGHPTRPPGGPPLTGAPSFPLRRPTTTDRTRARRRRPLADPTATAANPIGRRSAISITSPPRTEIRQARHPGPAVPGAWPGTPTRPTQIVRALHQHGVIGDVLPLTKSLAQAAEDHLLGPHGPGMTGLGALGPGLRLGVS